MMSAPLETRLAQRTWRENPESIPSDGQRQPQQENKLEGVVKGEPVDDAQKTLKNTAHVVSLHEGIRKVEDLKLT